MGVAVASDIFQSKVMQLMQDLDEFVRCYLNDLLIIGRNDFESHFEQLRVVLDRLQKAGLKVNADKSTALCLREHRGSDERMNSSYAHSG
jgi:hypothetical protein